MNINSLLEGLEITFEGKTGPLFVERNVLFVDAPDGFDVIHRFSHPPSFGEIERVLISKGIL